MQGDAASQTVQIQVQQPQQQAQLQQVVQQVAPAAAVAANTASAAQSQILPGSGIQIIQQVVGSNGEVQNIPVRRQY